MRNRTIGILSWLLLSAGAFSQTYKSIGIEDGLSNRRVYSIQKDGRGYMWFLTYAGIDRYDGKEIKHYKPADGKKDLDPLLNINWAYPDPDGSLLVAGREGRIFRYHAGQNRFVPIYRRTDDKSRAFVRYSFMDREGNAWLCRDSSILLYQTKTGKERRIGHQAGHITVVEQTNGPRFFVGTEKRLHVMELDGDSLREVPAPELEKQEMYVHELYLQRPTNKLFIGTFEKGIFVYDVNRRKLIRPALGLDGINITRMRPLNEKELLVATEGAGVYKLDADTYEISPYRMAGDDGAREADGSIINDIFVDDEQRVWFSRYDQGITVRNNRYLNYNWIRHLEGNAQSLADSRVHAVLEDSDGDLWFGTGNGISLYDTRARRWRAFPDTAKEGQERRNRIFLTLCEVTPGVIWAGGYSSGITQIDKRTATVTYLTPDRSFHMDIKPDKYIRAIKKDRDGFIWCGGYHNLKCLDAKNGKGRLYPGIGSVTAIEEKDSTHLWIGTSTGLYLLNKSSGKYEYMDLPGGATCVYTLFQATDGRLYIGTSGSGLIVYDPAEWKIATLYHTGNSPLVSNSIYTILPSAHEGELLMSTENGISSFSTSERTFRNWTRRQGLMPAGFNPNAGTRLANGDILFGSTDGALELPKGLRMPQPGISRMVFSDLRFFYRNAHPGKEISPSGEDIDRMEKLHLDYSRHSFSLRVSSIDYDSPSGILYTWQLEGFYKGWSTPDEEGNIRFIHLSPGTYLLRVRSIPKEDKQRVLQERTLKIVVAQPVWLDYRAVLLYLLTLALIIYIVLRLYSGRRKKLESDEQTRFFIHTAHDIRTPLTLIKAPLEAIRHKESLSEESRLNMGTALKNVDTLLRLTTNLINYGKTNVYASSLHVSENELASYMHDMLRAFQSFAESKHIALTYESNFQRLMVWFDREKMDSIIKNILSNALKYTPDHGKVHVKVHEEKDTWSIQVNDTGIGIPAKEQKKLFKLHFRGSNAINAKITGSGIGLMLVWRLVRMHKGKINMGSTENKGTRVKIIFPKQGKGLQRIASKAAPKEIPLTPDMPAMVPSTYKDICQQDEGQTRRILVVEDNDNLRHYLLRTLSENYRVEGTTNGKEALARLPEFKPDLVLSDIMMPHMRGDELCAALKNNIETSHIPVILLTALNDDQSIMDGLQTGADTYLVKPFNISLLKASVANLLANRALLRLKYADMELLDKETTASYGNTLDKKFLDTVKQTVEKNITTPDFNVDVLCAALNMSRSSFYNKLKALTGQAPADYIRLIRLKRAAELLSEGIYNVTEDPDRMLFRDEKYFREVFKKYFHVSPSKYPKEGRTGEDPIGLKAG